MTEPTHSSCGLGWISERFKILLHRERVAQPVYNAAENVMDTVSRRVPPLLPAGCSRRARSPRYHSRARVLLCAAVRLPTEKNDQSAEHLAEGGHS